MRIIPLLTLVFLGVGSNENQEVNRKTHYSCVRSEEVNISLHGDCWHSHSTSNSITWEGFSCLKPIKSNNWSVLKKKSTAKTNLLQNEAQDSVSIKIEENGFLQDWLIPGMVTVGAGLTIFTIYSVRGR